MNRATRDQLIVAEMEMIDRYNPKWNWTPVETEEAGLWTLIGDFLIDALIAAIALAALSGSLDLPIEIPINQLLPLHQSGSSPSPVP